ncbi:alpha/beta hydrolase family protein [Mucilaginibacter pineti]|nr:prolyl oligopeptidase family serine peptidase [Mucilaginibacter pineti]
MAQDSVNYSYLTKTELNFKSMNFWTNASSPSINNDGNYISYWITNSATHQSTLILKSLNSSWLISAPNVKANYFSDDNRHAFILDNRNELKLLELGSDKYVEKKNINSCEKISSHSREWLICYNSDKDLILLDTKINKEYVFPLVDSYYIEKPSKRIYVIRKVGSKNKLSYISIENQKLNQIGVYINGINDLIIDNNGTQIAFTVEEYATKKKQLYYSINDSKPKAVKNIPQGYSLSKLVRFGKKGKQIFLELSKKIIDTVKTREDGVDVWSYTDDIFSLVKDTPVPKITYAASLNLNNRSISILENDGENISSFDNCDDYVFLTAGKSLSSIFHWQKEGDARFFVINTLNNKRTTVNGNYVSFANSGKFLIYQVGEEYDDYESLEIATGKIYRITGNWPIDVSNSSYDVNGEGLRLKKLVPAGWLKDIDDVLMYDEFDIWQVSLKNLHQPQNLTKGCGREKHISFRFCDLNPNKDICLRYRYLLSGFSKLNKDNGFYLLKIGRTNILDSLFMGKYAFDLHLGQANGVGAEFCPIKAKEKDIWIVKRESVTESPNYFFTIDFKTFNEISFNHPEKQFELMDDRLVNFRKSDGTFEQGILYVPQNLDKRKKYPVIIHYYEVLSDWKNVFQQPNTTGSSINIPWFVNHGYLVFTPDIHYKIAEPGQSAYNSVMGAASYLKTLPYVDTVHMGLQGHSFGGFETNYIVTHTRIFAAAMASSGVSNLISSYNSITFNGRLKQDHDQYRMFGTPWEKPASYIENSPVFFADKVTTPLLLMNNKKDGAVPFAQGLEFFLSLRRLGKPVWLLQYDDEAHVLVKDENRELHTLRLTQFFDHYLKGLQAPKWMLNLNTSNSTPGSGLVSAEEQKKIDAYSKIPLSEKLKPLSEKTTDNN